MQRLGESTSQLIPKPKRNTEVQDSVSNENVSLFQAKATWIRDAKRFIIKESKNPFHNSEYASLAFVQRVIDNAVNYDLIMQNTFEYTENQCIFVSKLVHLPTQEMEISKIPMLLTKNDPQALSSAITYYRRLICATMLDIVTVDTHDEKEFSDYLFDDDDDGNSAMDNKDGDGSKGTSSKPDPKVSSKTKGSGENKELPKFKDEFEKIKWMADRCGTLDKLKAMWQEQMPSDKRAIDYINQRKKQITGE
tara:strand:+ start:120 stop:869 length:750 start_codon:yes stop_codon:yes gene_type:complete